MIQFESVMYLSFIDNVNCLLKCKRSNRNGLRREAGNTEKEGTWKSSRNKKPSQKLNEICL